MKHFGTLYWYELKKLLKRKLAWIMVLVIAAFMAYTAKPVSNSGGQQSISGQVMDERFFQNVREASNGSGLYIIREHLEQESYFYLVDSSYYDPCGMIAYQTELDPAETSAEDFYRNRQETIERQYSGRTDGEIAYWQNMEAQVEKPFVYRYTSGIRIFWQTFSGCPM